MEQSEKKVSKKDLFRVFLRSFALQGSESYTHMQALGYAFCMVPILRRIYKNNPQKLSEALKRHTTFFNTTPHVAPFIMGITAAMEEENEKTESFDTEAIPTIKAALMGPIAGIGDSFYWGTFRVVAAGVGLAFAMKGSILGPVLYFLIYTALHLLGRYYSLTFGYNLGTSFLEKAYENHALDKFSFGASVVGLMSIGAMTASLVSFQIPLKIVTKGGKIVIQDIFDKIFPGILPLALTFLVFYLLRKNVKVVYIILGIFVFAILGHLIGLL